MTEVVSIKFKSSGKSYYFAPNGLHIKDGETVIVETAKGLEIAECTHGNRFVEDSSVVQPLRPVIRSATAQDLRINEQYRIREKEALVICQQKIEAHGLDMKLVDVECSFDGSKTLFFFTSDGRVDFRELVKDLASVFHNRIELRQIGVRDEAKMLGGIGICGRPYCCSSFLNDFAPVSTKMAKIQNLSLNPAKISGSCGRLMCCLRYEEEAYEDLVKHVPKNGAFVETTAGYGTVISVDLLRQRVKVHIENEADDVSHVLKAAEVAAVPGGHPKEGEPYPHVLQYTPEAQEESDLPEDPWTIPTLFADAHPEEAVTADESAAAEGKDGSAAHSSGRRRRSNRRGKNPSAASRTPAEKAEAEKPAVQKQPDQEGEKSAPAHHSRKSRRPRSAGTPHKEDKQKAENEHPSPAGGSGEKSSAPKKKSGRRRFYSLGKKSSGHSSTPSA